MGCCLGHTKLFTKKPWPVFDGFNDGDFWAAMCDCIDDLGSQFPEPHDAPGPYVETGGVEGTWTTGNCVDDGLACILAAKKALLSMTESYIDVYGRLWECPVAEEIDELLDTVYESENELRVTWGSAIDALESAYDLVRLAFDGWEEVEVPDPYIASTTYSSTAGNGTIGSGKGTVYDSEDYDGHTVYWGICEAWSADGLPPDFSGAGSGTGNSPGIYALAQFPMDYSGSAESYEGSIPYEEVWVHEEGRDTEVFILDDPEHLDPMHAYGYGLNAYTVDDPQPDPSDLPATACWRPGCCFIHPTDGGAPWVFYMCVQRCTCTIFIGINEDFPGTYKVALNPNVFVSGSGATYHCSRENGEQIQITEHTELDIDLIIDAVSWPEVPPLVFDRHEDYGGITDYFDCYVPNPNWGFDFYAHVEPSITVLEKPVYCMNDLGEIVPAEQCPDCE